MLVRIRLPRGAATGKNKPRIGPVTFIAAGLLRMTAVACLMLALWRLTSDLGWTGAFFIDDGLFSHWQVWLGVTFALTMLSFRLARYSHSAELPVSAVAAPVAEPEKPELARRGVIR